MRIYMLRHGENTVRLIGMPGNLMPSPSLNARLKSIGYSLIERSYAFVQTHDVMEQEIAAVLALGGKTLPR